MQVMAAYDEQRETGLYVALHDPNASAKDISVASSPENAPSSSPLTIPRRIWGSQAMTSP